MHKHKTKSIYQTVPVYFLLAFFSFYMNPKCQNNINNTAQLGSHALVRQSAERLYMASRRRRRSSESSVTARGDRLAGAAEANKGPARPRPPLPPVTRRYLLRALF